jgi:hypothetical protein
MRQLFISDDNRHTFMWSLALCSEESTVRVEGRKAASPMGSVVQPSSEGIRCRGTKRSNANNAIPCRVKTSCL